MADGEILIDAIIDNTQAQKELAALSKQIKKLQSELNAKQGEQNAIEKEMVEASDAAERTRAKIAELAKSALIFSVMTRALTLLRDAFVRVVKANDDAAAAFGRLKGAALTMVQPILEGGNGSGHI